jgi:hypothetical protein
MTAANALHGEPQTTQYAMRFERFKRILRTTGGVTTMATEHGAQQVTISLDQ